jgi:hypothetical protein
MEPNVEHDATLPQHGALLIADIGSDSTQVTLVDLVDQNYRLVARAASPSTFDAPDHDPTTAIFRAVREIEATTSRTLLRGDDLITPQNEAGDGVDGVVATTSATGPIGVAVAGLSKAGSVRSARHAARSTYTTLIDTIALDEGGTQIGQHVLALHGHKPDVIVLAGGTEGGSVTANQRLAQIVKLLATHSDHAPLVIFAGNSAAADQVRQQIGEAAKVEVVDNLLPLPNQPRIEPVRSILRRYYNEQKTAKLPGADHLRKLRATRLGSAIEDQSLMVRFLAQRFGRNVLSVSVDGAATACLLASDSHYSEAIFGQLGLRHGALAVLDERGVDNIARWLPFAIDEPTLRNRLLNRVLRPRQVPTDLDDLLLDYAILREALSTAYTALRDERPRAPFDLVIAGGAMADAPRPGLAALALLDALQPTIHDSDLAINLYLDQFGLLAASGALAHLDTDAAACLLEQDGLNNLPLATVIVPHGEIAAGKNMVEVELRPVRGDAIKRTVKAGEIARLPLGRGKRATLRIQPVSGVAIGHNQAGTEVLSDEAAIVGSALGVIIDARPRPLALPTDFEQRRTTLLRWMEALDALPPATAFAPASDGVAATSNGTMNGTSHAATATPPVESTTESHSTDDIASLREGLVMTPQPKRGFFRKK